MLKGKAVVLGVTGGIAAYKAAGIASLLVKQNCEVHVIMTKNAENFIAPLTFETLTNNKCIQDTFDRNFQYNVEHVSLAKKADVLLIAPGTANVIGKLAGGIADDMLTTTALACTCKKIIAPAMNHNMHENRIVQDNLQKLENYGWRVIPSACGRLACGDIGKGKLPDEQVIVDEVLRAIAFERDMEGKKVLVTAGATQEAIDPVRFISNHSTGKMGYAIARNCMLRGADVTLITGHASVTPPPFVKVISVVSAVQMAEAVKEQFETQDIIIKSAAVADYTPAETAKEKIKKQSGDMTIPLERTEDILKYLGEHRKEGQFICGFSMETEHMLENSKKKLEKKKIQMIVANNLKEEGAGFGVDTNRVTFITENETKELPLLSKDEVANQLVNFILGK